MKIRRNKYAAHPCVIDGIRFASKKEGGRYTQLKLLERAGEIADLECHPSFKIEVAGQKICTYVADFRYLDVHKGDVVVEDVKGMKTPVYRLKKKLVRALHNVEIREI